MRNASARLHSPREYLAVFKAGGSPVSFSPKPAVSLSSPPSATSSLFVWRNSGRATPRGSSDSCISGIPSALSLRCPLRRSCACLRRQQDLFFFASAVYVVSCLTLAVPSLWALFGGLWLIAFGEFVVHSISPGLINHQAMLSGHATAVWSMGFFFPVIISAGFSAPTFPELSIRGSAGLLLPLYSTRPGCRVFRSVQTEPDGT